ncbi:histidine phosphatase family protein [Mucilaginibacter sp. BJC16-A38]|uniref:histidine phosphatase family protein n=1 Tax=Mucilaginibacter phenanthrenivorans TaxID=1234842 RepID=UPI00215895CA|nr:histidine phosphatase family protein [Mucilaginibacter phenanthrenivorans]MCR8556340.1 histidine phosphatase family protein [Mucilaginibacter phenanthrenivorans]
MKNILLLLTIIFMVDGISSCANAQQSDNLKIVLVRHGEKEATGESLNCQGLNRAIQLPKVIVSKFGTPSVIFVPTLNAKSSTTHARMFQTASPLAIKYSLSINSKYAVDDYPSLAQSIQAQTGTVLVVWEHKAMDNILKALGVKTKGLKWGDDDFDSIWIVTYKNGKPVLSVDKEGLHPASNCQF